MKIATRSVPVCREGGRRLRVWLAVFFSLLVRPATAENLSWSAAVGNWFTASNWSPAQVPTGADNVYLRRSGGGIAQIASGTAYANDLYISADNRLDLSGGTLDMNYSGRTQYIGHADYSTGTISQTGGNNSVGYLLYLGYGTGATGCYTMSGGSLYVDNSLYLGYGDNAIGILLHSGGSLTVNGQSSGRMRIGRGTGSSGTYRISGSATLTVNGSAGIEVGNGGYGRFEWFREGGVTAAKIQMESLGTLAMGYDFNAIPGLVQGLANATLEVTNNATVTKNDGIESRATNLRIGSATGNAAANMSSGTVNITQTVWIGDGGGGTVTQSGGVLRVGSGHLYLGHGGGNGTYTLTGGTLNLNDGNANLFVGSAGASDGSTGRLVLRGGTMNVYNIFMPYTTNANSTGALVLDGGTLTVNGNTIRVTNLTLGEVAGRTGSFTLVAGKTLAATTMKVGDAGAGNWTQSGGTANVANLHLGAQSGGNGIYTLTGGSLNVSGPVLDGAGTGTLQIDGGAFTPSGGVAVDQLKVGIGNPGNHTQSGQLYTVGQLVLGNALYRLTGGTLAVGGMINEPGTGTLNLDGGTFAPSGAVNVDQLGVGIGTAGAHEQTGQDYTAGTLTLGAGTYTLSGGTLAVGSVANGSGDGILALNGGTLQTTGNVAADLLQIGVNAPAAHTLSAGVWTIGNLNFGIAAGGAGALTLASGGTLDIAGHIATGAGSGALTLNGGTLAIGGNLAVSEFAVGSGTTAGHAHASKRYDVSGNVTVGDGAGGAGTYRLEGTGELNIGNRLYIGRNGGAGRFEWYHSGGLSAANGIAMGAGSTLAMGADFDADALAGHGGGLVSGLSEANLEITRGARAIQDADTVRVAQLRIGGADGGGAYRLEGSGDLVISDGGRLLVGTADGAAGRFEWYRGAGSLATPDLTLFPSGTLAMGADFDAVALANGTLFGGVLSGLSAAVLEVTHNATATQEGGKIAVYRLNIGTADGAGLWQLSAGSLSADDIRIGQAGEGTLRLEGGQLNVARELNFGREARLAAVPGSQVRLTGTDVRIMGGNPAHLADLVHLTLVFEPENPASQSTLEVAGKNIGEALKGFEDNFALDGLVVGGPGRPGNVKLVDVFRNQGPEEEALYVHSIYVLPGSVLNLNNLRVYYDREFVNEGAVEGGMPILIPEPTSLGLLALAAGALRGGRKFLRVAARA